MPEPTTAPAWHIQHAQVLDFGRILSAADTLTSAADVLDYLTTPDAFTREHDLWTQAGRPRPPCVDDLTEARTLGPGPAAAALWSRHRAAGIAWRAFCDLLDESAHTGRPLHVVVDGLAP
ncbi:hypothetical protein Mycsm_07271 (plasmid) [Mycobacterium sp. JS623]|uniref:hypothetical protein n=1 Tax=Mycobacterium sp. JS623 TaxID=212767 RepID=UPI0002A5653C|nr:hypothetical protein [Mycobacterium sp. JS623]AGB27364.1 hypothetical protein Mycsm_07271 [Mycobacterium sp. JS623]